MKMKSEVATEKFLSGYNCAQAILYAVGTDLGLEAETALKAATGLGAGMGRRGEVSSRTARLRKRLTRRHWS